MTGIGGQGIQLAARVLAQGAIAEGREVQLFGSYGGMMRGGSTEATLVVADRPVLSPPTIGTTWSAILMHHAYAQPTLARLGPGSVVVVNTSVFEGPRQRPDCVVVDVAATDTALELGNMMVASMVMLGAYAAVTGLVTIGGLLDAVAASLPSYRTQHGELNRTALQVGYDRAPVGLAPAWAEIRA